MAIVIHPEPVPLAVDGDGVVRVGGTRVTLETIVAAFSQGATAEEIAQQYPTVSLTDIYTAIGYYLRHRIDVEEYIEKRRRESEAARKEMELSLGPDGIRERLLARRAAKG
jgi:uncharacterized protein (DUF433 family)